MRWRKRTRTETIKSVNICLDRTLTFTPQDDGTVLVTGHPLWKRLDSPDEIRLFRPTRRPE